MKCRRKERTDLKHPWLASNLVKWGRRERKTIGSMPNSWKPEYLHAETWIYTWEGWDGSPRSRRSSSEERSRVSLRENVRIFFDFVFDDPHHFLCRNATLHKIFINKIYSRKFCCWVLWPSHLLSIREDSKNSPEILHSRKNTVECRSETPSLLCATPDVLAILFQHWLKE